MKMPRAFSLIDTFSPKERRKFKKYLKSPFFNYQPALIALLSWWLEVPEKKRANVVVNLSADTLYQVIYGHTTAGKTAASRRRKVYNTLSDLALAAEKFIAVTALQHDPLQKSLYVADYLAKKSNRGLFMSSGIHKLESALEEHGDAQKKLHYRYLKDQLLFSSIHYNKLKKERAAALINDMFTSLYLSVDLARLRHWCDLSYRANFLSGVWKDIDRDDIRKQTKEIMTREELPVIRLFGKLIQLSEIQDGTAAFIATYNYFKDQLPAFSFDDRNEVLRYLLNYCIQRYRKGDTSFLEHKLELERWGIEKDILIGPDGLEDDLFINIALTAIALPDQHQVTEKFVEKHQHKLTKSKRRDAVNLVMAHWEYFVEKQPKAAAEALERVKTIDYKYVIRKHPLRLRIGYDLADPMQGAYEHLDGIIRAYYDWLANNLQLKKRDKAQHRRLIWFVRQMHEYRWNPNKQNAAYLEQLNQELADHPPLLSNWVADRLAALK